MKGTLFSAHFILPPSSFILESRPPSRSGYCLQVKSFDVASVILDLARRAPVVPAEEPLRDSRRGFDGVQPRLRVQPRHRPPHQAVNQSLGHLAPKGEDDLRADAPGLVADRLPELGVA